MKKTEHALAHSWLLIFDNVEDITDLEAFLPTNTMARGAVIITTQKTEMRPVTDHFYDFDLENLEREVGSELFFRYLKRPPSDGDEEEIARELSDHVDGSPLALATISGYICESQSTVIEFLESFKRSSKVWGASAGGPAKQYKGTLETVFKIALEELPDDARHLLHLLAFLNPDSIPEDLFIMDQHDAILAEDDCPEHPVREVLFNRAESVALRQ